MHKTESTAQLTPSKTYTVGKEKIVYNVKSRKVHWEILYWDSGGFLQRAPSGLDQCLSSSSHIYSLMMQPTHCGVSPALRVWWSINIQWWKLQHQVYLSGYWTLHPLTGKGRHLCKCVCVWRGGVYDGWCWGWRWSDYIEFAGIWVSLWLTSRALSRTLHPVLKKWKQLKCRCYIQVQPSTHRSCQTLQIAFSPSTAAYFSQQFSRGMKKHSQDYLQATSILWYLLPSRLYGFIQATRRLDSTSNFSSSPLIEVWLVI